MKWVLRIGLGFLGLVLTSTLLAVGWWVSATQFGWRDMPDSPAPSQSEVYDARFEATGEAAVAALSAMRAAYGVPGATAAVSLDGELVWAGAVGWSDLEAQTPMSIDSIMRIGSTSKSMTTTVLARLSDAGTLAMTDTVADHAAPLNPDWGPLQLFRLMSHTAGGFPRL